MKDFVVYLNYLNVEAYNSIEKFILNYHSSKQGCLVLDIDMSIMSSIKLLERLNLVDSLSTIVTSDHSDIPLVVRVIQAGAVDFILKPVDDQYLLNIIYYHLEKFYKKNQPVFFPQKNILTKREYEIIQLIINGKLNKEIAYELKISISTVEAHRSRIMNKFYAKNLAQLIKNYFQIPDYYYK